MSYHEQIDELIASNDLGSNFYSIIKRLLEEIYSGTYKGPQQIFSGYDLLVAYRAQKLKRHSPKLLLSATDCRRYMREDILEKLVGEGASDVRCRERALYILEHIWKKITKKETYQNVQAEQPVLQDLHRKIELGKLTPEDLLEPKTAELIEDINPYKSIEDYLKAEELPTSNKSRWDRELPVLLILLGVDPALLQDYIDKIDHQSTPTEEVASKPRDELGSIKKHYYLPYVLVLIPLGALTLWLFSLSNDPPAMEVHSELVRTPVDEKIDDTQILGPFYEVGGRTSGPDSVVLQEISVASHKVLIEGLDTIPLGLAEISFWLRNTSTTSHYAFEELLLLPLRPRTYIGSAIPAEKLDQQLPTFLVNCRPDRVKSWTILNPTKRILAPGFEVKGRFLIAAEQGCTDQVIPYKLGVRFQNTSLPGLQDPVIWSEDTLSLATM